MTWVWGRFWSAPAMGDAGAGRQALKVWNWGQGHATGDFKPSLTFGMADQEYLY